MGGVVVRKRVFLRNYKTNFAVFGGGCKELQSFQ